MGKVLGVVHGRRKAMERERLGLEGGGDDNGVVKEEEEGGLGYNDGAVVTFKRLCSCLNSYRMRI